MKKECNVLLIDDDEYLRLLYARALEDDGFNVTDVSTVKEALEMLKHQRYDVIVSDIMLDGEDVFAPRETAGGHKTGLTFARKVQREYPEIILAALTLSEDREVVEWFSKSKRKFFPKLVITPHRLPKQLRLLFQPGSVLPRVFIVHGHDINLLMETKDFVQNRLKFGEPIILAEQQSKGQTLLEKFELYASEADIVFVLMTPDDYVNAGSAGDVKQRARQNVIFELGYFYAAKQRINGHILILYKGRLELPSDLSGLVYFDVSNGLAACAENIRKELTEWLL